MTAPQPRRPGAVSNPYGRPTASNPLGAGLVRRGRGRPPIDPNAERGNTSTMWNVRAPISLNAAALTRAEAEGIDLSSLVRKAVSQYLERPR